MPVIYLEGNEDMPQEVDFVIIASSVNEIGRAAFYDCKLLTSVELSGGLKRIGHESFRGCRSLTTMRFPSTLQYIGREAFMNCSGLINLQFPDGLNMIDEKAFQNCTCLTNIGFSSGMKEIRKGAFANCHRLSTVKLSEGLLVLGESVFSKCYALCRAIIPSTLKRLQRYVFLSCHCLEFVELVVGLEVIAEGAFMGCSKLQSVKIPQGVKELGLRSFFACQMLLSLELPEGLLSIGNGAFGACGRMCNVFLPSSCEELWGNIFENRQIMRGQSSLVQNPLELYHASQPRQLMSELRTRFDGLPIHEICYFQAHYPTLRTLIALKQAMEDATSSAPVDKFLMTPFHIVAVSVKPNFNIFIALMEAYPKDTIVKKDRENKTPLEYLCGNTRPSSLPSIHAVLRFALHERLQYMGLACWRSDILDNVLSLSGSPTERLASIRTILGKLDRYERLECLSLLELLLWKFEIDSSSLSDPCQQRSPKRFKREENHSFRQGCRVSCGADIVISNILPFLGPVGRINEDFDLVPRD